ncbi:MAG: lipid IV(A) 3-deoxy-D-manno-octulosonic acid transferase [Gammaproteobacteria bacterium]|nr:lipid IV(A) 3-deoxy-D-manno-octulosonic acid transferase [Gammaproteobacteria bacterium]MDH5225873.1 lipid IV(A) 3-deoxy-D-manno-octulosonic acid transferase [Gammaproteobacteria bacterium]
MRMLYVLLVYLLAPIVVAHEAWQALRDPAYRGRLGQRLGFAPRPDRTGSLWIHAVSVGEVQAAAGLIRELRRRHPALPIVVTTTTPTGAQRARALYQDAVHHCYLPYDLPGAVSRFLDRIAPQAAIILETEIWPTLYAALERRGIPLVLGSARVTPRSVGRYRKLASLFRDALANGITIGAQTPGDAERFIAVGAPRARVQVTGNIKYDLTIPPSTVEAGRALREQWDSRRPAWIAGSTHEGEEEAALAAHAMLSEQFPNALLLLVPRHPQRFDAVRALLRRRDVPFAMRSAGALPAAGDAVLLVDTIGELQMFYAAADVAFVAGSLVPIGGHSLLEPAVLGLPILSGPHTQNSQDVADLLAQSGALRVVQDAQELGHQLLEHLADPARAQAIGAAGRDAVAANRGAVSRLVAMIEPLLRSWDVRPATSSASSDSR